MLSAMSFEEKYNQVRRNFCFYLDVQDHGLAKSLSRRIQDMGLQQEVFLTSRVTHVVRDRPPALPQRCARRNLSARADAMLERVRQAPIESPPPELPPHYTVLTVQKAINLLDKLYDTFFTAPRKSNVKIFTKHFIKIEFLDKLCRPIYKEFDEWPDISLEPNPPKEIPLDPQPILINKNNNTIGQKMTRKSRPKIKEKDDKDQKGGFCEMCNADYVDAALHRRSPHHLAFVRDHTNFIALDSLISAGADVSTFLGKSAPINGERRSLRKMCNGDIDSPKSRRSKRSQSPEPVVNGNQSPKCNGGLEDERKSRTRCSKKSNDSQVSDDRQYYKVVSTKLRSSGGFQVKKKDSLPTCNGTKPLVVKFKKVRRSELSVLSDEAEQFMFPKRASSSSSSSSEEEDEEDVKVIARKRRKSPPQAPTPITLERQRLARPLALKEESSEEDSWPEDNRRPKRRVVVVPKKTRRLPRKTYEEYSLTSEREETPVDVAATAEPKVSPLREEPKESCMTWEDGKLKYTPAVEKLRFAFESVPHSEPWFETFKRQDQDKIVAKNVPRYFELYYKSPKLPYEIGHLPPLKPNCCPLSDLVRRDEKPGPSRSYGTRGMKKQKIRKRTAAVIALESHSRKSPREHASTLAILGSAGLLHRRKNIDDTKSTASEDTISDTISNTKLEPTPSANQIASERLQQFFSEVFEDDCEYDLADEVFEGESTVIASNNAPDVLSLVSECENCDIIQKEIKDCTAKRRGRFKKKNRTGWPNKKKQKKSSRASSAESGGKTESSAGRSSVEFANFDETAQDAITEEDTLSDKMPEDDDDKPKSDDSQETFCEDVETEVEREKPDKEKKTEEEVKPEVQLDVKVVVQDKEKVKREKRSSRSSASEEREERKKRKRKSTTMLGDWLQPVVRVARVDDGARRLRSAARPRASRFR